MLHRIIIFYNKIEINRRRLVLFFSSPSLPPCQQIDRSIKQLAVYHRSARIAMVVDREDRNETIGDDTRWLETKGRN